jgi:hypothetical protein
LVFHSLQCTMLSLITGAARQEVGCIWCRMGLAVLGTDESSSEMSAMREFGQVVHVTKFAWFVHQSVQLGSYLELAFSIAQCR